MDLQGILRLVGLAANATVLSASSAICLRRVLVAESLRNG